MKVFANDKLVTIQVIYYMPDYQQLVNEIVYSTYGINFSNDDHDYIKINLLTFANYCIRDVILNGCQINHS